MIKNIIILISATLISLSGFGQFKKKDNYPVDEFGKEHRVLICLLRNVETPQSGLFREPKWTLVMHNNKVRRLVSMFYSGPVIFVNEDSLSLDKYSVDKHPEYRYVFKSGYIAATSMDPTANYHSPFSVHDTPTTRLVFMLNDRETGKSYDTFSMYAIRSQIKRHMKRLELARLKEN